MQIIIVEDFMSRLYKKFHLKIAMLNNKLIPDKLLLSPVKYQVFWNTQYP